MKHTKICKVLTVALLFTGAFVVRAMAQSPEPMTKRPATPQLLAMPLSFEPNQGQTDNGVKFLSRGDGYALFLTSNEAVFTLSRGSEANSPRSVLRMELLGANESTEMSGAEKLSGTTNYFIGNDSKKWHSGVPTYGKVNYRGIYAGVDAVFCKGDAPGASN